jgi:hypothetical protein
MAYSFVAVPKVVKSKPKYRPDGAMMAPLELERDYVNEQEEKYKADNMEQ